MTINLHLPSLQEILGPTVEILTDPQNHSFVEQARRWTDIDRQIPAATVLPINEGDCQKVVRWVVGAGIPFVVRGGGHSQWSTIGDEGIIIDLTRMVALQVDKEAQTVTVKGGVSSKQVAVALAEHGLFTALGNGNTVGGTSWDISRRRFFYHKLSHGLCIRPDIKCSSRHCKWRTSRCRR
ncbi:hypothetical protein ACMFMG_004045 [Clarireedia jacksonii]